MIVDHLSNLSKYLFIDSNIGKAIDFIKHNDLMELPQGKTIIDRDEIFILRETYPSKAENECYFEGHLKYMDIQVVLKGSEYIGYSNKQNKNITVTEPYNMEKDVEIYQIQDFTKVHLYKDMFAMVFPDDLHMPKLRKEEMIIEKVVIKVKLSNTKE